VVTKDRDHAENGLAYAIPTPILVEVWPELPQVADGASSDAVPAGGASVPPGAGGSNIKTAVSSAQGAGGRNLTDADVLLLARCLLAHISATLASPNPATKVVELGAGRIVRLTLADSASSNVDVIRRLRNGVNLIEALDRRIGFLRNQQIRPIGEIIDMAPEIETKQAERAQEVSHAREAIQFLVQELRLE
jgi:hypothetical protein